MQVQILQAANSLLQEVIWMTRVKVQVLSSECRLMTYGYLTDNLLSRPSINMITNWETLIKITKTIKKNTT